MPDVPDEIIKKLEQAQELLKEKQRSSQPQRDEEARHIVDDLLKYPGLSPTVVSLVQNVSNNLKRDLSSGINRTTAQTAIGTLILTLLPKKS